MYFRALKVSITLAVIGAVVAQLVAADCGLGYFIAHSTSMFRIPLAFAGRIILFTLGLLLFRALTLLQRLIAPWSVLGMR